MSAVASLESRGFKIAVLAGSAVAAGVTFANIIFYSRMRKDTSTNPPVSKTQATWMMWINIGLFVVSLVLLVWSVWALLFSRETRARYKQAALGYVSGGLQSAQGFLTSTAPLLPAAPVPAPAVPSSALQPGIAAASVSGVPVVNVGLAPPQAPLTSASIAAAAPRTAPKGQ